MSFSQSARFALSPSSSVLWSFLLEHPLRICSQLEFQQHSLVIKDLDGGVETTRVQIPTPCFINSVTWANHISEPQFPHL